MAEVTIHLSLSHKNKINLVYQARRDLQINPSGHFCSGRWYPDVNYEGGTPDVRPPSCNWPNNYIKACRTRKWVARFPIASLDADVREIVQYLVTALPSPWSWLFFRAHAVAFNGRYVTMCDDSHRTIGTIDVAGRK